MGSMTYIFRDAAEISNALDRLNVAEAHQTSELRAGIEFNDTASMEQFAKFLSQFPNLVKLHLPRRGALTAPCLSILFDALIKQCPKLKSINIDPQTMHMNASDNFWPSWESLGKALKVSVGATIEMSMVAPEDLDGLISLNNAMERLWKKANLQPTVARKLNNQQTSNTVSAPILSLPSASSPGPSVVPSVVSAVQKPTLGRPVLRYQGTQGPSLGLSNPSVVPSVVSAPLQFTSSRPVLQHQGPQGPSLDLSEHPFFKSVPINWDGIAALLEPFKNLTSFELNLSKNGLFKMSRSDWSSFTEVFNQVEHLQKLDLSENNLPQVEGDIMGRCILALKKCKNLEVIVLDKEALEGCDERQFSGLLTLWNNCRNLKSIIAAGCNTSDQPVISEILRQRIMRLEAMARERNAPQTQPDTRNIKIQKDLKP